MREIDFHSDANKPLAELLTGKSLDEMTEDEVENEVGCKIFLVERKLVKLLKKTYVVNRFVNGKIKWGGWDNDDFEHIKFKANKPIRIHGLEVFGHNTAKTCQITIEVNQNS